MVEWSRANVMVRIEGEVINVGTGKPTELIIFKNAIFTYYGHLESAPL
jgi:hypothetical protein